MKKLITILVVAALAAGGIVLVRHKKLSIAAAGVQTIRATVARTAVARKGDLFITRNYLARVEPWRSAAIGAQIASRVRDILVQEGDLVSRGQILAVLDGGELLARVQGGKAGVLQSRMQAEAASATMVALEKTLGFRERELGRDERLVREGAIARVVADTSRDQLNEIKGRVDAMEKTMQAARQQIKVRQWDLEQARTRLAYAQILAPFDGVVTKRLADPGDMAGPNQILVNIEDHSRLRICFDVPQSELSRIKPTMAVTGASGSNLHLSVSRIHPSLNRDRTLTVECDAPGPPELWVGSTLQVEVILNRFKNEVLLPEESLIPVPGGGDAVFIVENGATKVMPVKILGRNAGMVALRGVDPGTQVVQNTYLGWNRLAAGEPVEVLP
jgi:RND family efflux transporter MFP subunit